MGDTPGRVAVQVPEVAAGKVQGKHSASSLKGGEWTGVWRPLRGKFWKLEQKHCLQGVFGVRSQWIIPGKNLFEVHLSYF